MYPVPAVARSGVAARLLPILASFLAALPLTAQGQQGIVNCGFESGDLTGWTVEYAYRSCNAFSAWGAPTTHTPAGVIGVNTLPFPCQTLMVQPYKGAFMARINDPYGDGGNNGHNHATRLRQTFSPTAADIALGGILGVQWGAMLLDGGHLACDQPGFSIEVKKNGQPMCSFDANATQASGWQVAGSTCGSLRYKHGSWCCDLKPLATSDVIEVILTAWDCTAGGHGAYAFLDDVCFRSCTPPPPDMVGWWHDGTLLDLAGPPYQDGAWSGGNGTTPNGRVDGGLQHSPAWGVVADDAELDFGPNQDFSVDLWVYPELSPTVQPFVAKGSALDGPGYRFALIGGIIHVDLGDGSTRQTWNFPEAPIPFDEWTHLAFTLDRSGSGVLTCYVNGGALAFTPAPLTTSLSNNEPLLLGCADYAGLKVPFLGRTDEIEIFRRVLTAAEVQAIHGAGCKGKCKPERRHGVSPVGATWAEGNTNNAFPFHSDTIRRYLQLHGDVDDGVPWAITQLRFRPDTPATPTNLTGTRAIDLELLMGPGPARYSDVSRDFAANYSSPPSTVMSRRVVVWGPQGVTVAGGPQPFSSAMVLPLDAPFLWTGGRALTWESVIHGNSRSGTFGALDVERGSFTIASRTTVGTGCTCSGQSTTHNLSASVADVQGWLGLTVGTIAGPPNAPVFTAVGMSNPNLPFPGLCGSLYTDLLALLPTGITSASGALPTSDGLFMFVPNTIGGATLYLQNHALDIGLPGLGICNSAGGAFVIPAPNTGRVVRVSRMFDSSNTTTATRGVASATGTLGYGLVVEFR